MVEDIISSIRAAFLAAVIITIGAVVFINVQKSVQDPFFVGESLGNMTDNSTAFSALSNIPVINETSTFAVFNSSNGTARTALSECTLADGGLAPCYSVVFATGVVTVNMTFSQGDAGVNSSIITVDYRQNKQGFSTSGARDAIDNIGTNASGGFELGGVAIIIIFAGIILAALFATMVFRR